MEDPHTATGSENNFGLIKLNNQAKYAIWDLLDQGKFEGLTRDGKALSKTYNGDFDALMAEVETPPIKSQAGLRKIATVNSALTSGQAITHDNYLVVHQSLAQITKPPIPVLLLN